MKTLLFLMTLLFSFESFSDGCFETHMKHAILRNQNRKSFYSNPKYNKDVRRTAGFIANSLIIGERASLPTARNYDERAKYFQDHGLTIVCDELIAINDIRPPVVFKEPEGAQPQNFITSHAFKLGKEIKQAVVEDDLSKVITIVQTKLDELATRPDYNCLMRNDLRTILFIAQRAPYHVKKAQELGIESPKELSYALIKKMAGALYLIDFYDRKAFPVQKQGISIICQDFPGARGSN